MADATPEALADADAAIQCRAYLSMTDALAGVRYIAAEHESKRVTNGQALIWILQAAKYAIDASHQAWPWLDEYAAV